MLVELNINNFAIIDDISVSFANGLNIITGETGSGKSIIIEALSLILGERTNKEFIQTGKESAYLEAVFYIDNLDNMRDTTDKYGIEFDLNDRLLIVSREINVSGPSISKINGRTVNLGTLNDVTTKLVDISGQHEHQSLLDVQKHEKLVDSFGDEEFNVLKSEIYKMYQDLRMEEDKLKKLSIDNMERDREIDVLQFQIDEIDEVKLKDEDEEDINNEYLRLYNVQEISSSLVEIVNSLDVSYESTGAIDILNKDSGLLKEIGKYDENLLEFSNRLESLKYELEDLNRGLKNYQETIEFDQERLVFLEKRVDIVYRLKKKYGLTVSDILKFRDESEDRLVKLKNSEVEIEGIEERIVELRKILREDSEILSKKRKGIAGQIEELIKNELRLLNMEKVDFVVDFKEKDISSTGIDGIEFLISTNLGESLKPLSKIASGGEMSRIMLAFKNILAIHDKIPTLIFDEIDTGISGRTAQTVGEKIYEISGNHQVICISHLPQIASFADSHYQISKVNMENKTRTNVSKLSFEERIEEMARLLGGVNLTETTLNHAREMIEMSNSLKDQK